MYIKYCVNQKKFMFSFSLGKWGWFELYYVGFIFQVKEFKGLCIGKGVTAKTFHKTNRWSDPSWWKGGLGIEQALLTQGSLDRLQGRRGRSESPSCTCHFLTPSAYNIHCAKEPCFGEEHSEPHHWHDKKIGLHWPLRNFRGINYLVWKLLFILTKA